jgi:hypothetical protein
MSAKSVGNFTKARHSAKPERIATCSGCFGEKRLQARGLCFACYGKTRRAGVTSVKKLQRTVATLEGFVELAKRELQEGLLEAAQNLRKASRVAAAKGDSRPSEVILRETPVGPSGLERLLSPVRRDAEGGGGAGVRVFIGVALGGSNQPASCPNSVSTEIAGTLDPVGPTLARDAD